MTLYQIQIGTKKAIRLSFEVMARDSIEATVQHLGLALEGERVEVIALKGLA
jgi:hypothetical protein